MASMRLAAGSILVSNVSGKQSSSFGGLRVKGKLPCGGFVAENWRGRSLKLNVNVVAEKEENNSSITVSEDEEEELDEEAEALVPTPFEIESLLMELCDETSIAELQVKVGSFKLSVRRDVGGKAAKASAAVPVAPPPVPSRPMIDSLPAVPAPTSRASVEESEDEKDETLAYVTSPRVGIFRRGRTIKGKQGKPMVKIGDDVKKGQVVGYLEQLGTQLAIETDQAGEVVDVLAEDGAPVGYADSLLSIRPSFPGIKKLN